MGGGRSTHDGFRLGFGLEQVGHIALKFPVICALLMALITVGTAYGYGRLKVDDSLTELFRNNSEEFRRYELVSERFPSSEYDVLVVVEGRELLKPQPLDALRNMVVDLNLTDGVVGVVSMFSARGKPDGGGYAAPLVPDELPEGAAYDAMIKGLRSNEIVDGKFLSPDGELTLIVLSLDRKVVDEKGAATIIGGISDTAKLGLKDSGLSVKLTGAPVMQLEIRNAVRHDQYVYNGIGLLFGALVAIVFFRRVSLMLVAAVPPVIAIIWSLGLLGWLGFRLNLFLNVMTPLILVLGFADSMQMTSAIRIQLREGQNKRDAIRFAINVVGPACVLAHGAVLLSFVALLLSDSGLIRTFGEAGAISTIISFIAVMIVLPLLGLALIRNEASLARDRTPADGAMDKLGNLVGWIVDRVVHRPVLYSLTGLALLVAFSYVYSTITPRYRLADQVPDREQALAATDRLDQKLTGANPVHIMIEWEGTQGLYASEPMTVIAKTHEILEKQAGLGNVWSLESLRRWLADAGDTRVETVKSYVDVLPGHLKRRFIAEDEKSVLVTGRLPDIDASLILPVVDRLDKALDGVRQAHPNFTISVTGLPAIAARNSAAMINQLNSKLPLEVGFVSALIGLAFRSVFAGIISLLPGMFPIVTSGAMLVATGDGLEFASVVALIVVFGLGVDSLIHFLNRLRLEERDDEDPALAIRRARVLVGPALILTTIVLAFGLGITVFSDLPSLRLFGKVCGITLVAALLADLVFLPATIVLWQRWRRSRVPSQSASGEGELPAKGR